MESIKVLLVEDDPVWVKNMVKFLNKQEDIIVVSIASTKEHAVKLAKTIDFDIILMDINLSKNNYDGIYAAMEILEFKKIKIIMLTCLMEEDIITNSFTVGAVNYILKENYLEIPNAIRAAYYSKSPIEALLNEFSRLKKEEKLKELSSAEKEIYKLLEKGYTYQQIEKDLVKSKNTIKTQIRNILKKLNVNKVKEAIHKVNFKNIIDKEKANDKQFSP